MFKKLDKLMDVLYEMGIPGLSICVKVSGKEVYRRYLGYSDSNKTKPVDGSEYYNLYSCTKPITVTAGMQLYEKGKFDLDDNLSKYLPEFSEMYVREGTAIRPAIGDIKVADLFKMTAGFTYDLGTQNIRNAIKETNGVCKTRDVMKYLAKDPLVFDPGKTYRYSLCHDVLAALIEAVSDMSFGQYVKQNIFDPCGMTHSTFLPTKEQTEKLAAQYWYNAEKGIYELISGENQFRLGTMYESGGAGCVSTLDDYSNFLEGLRIGGVLLSDKTAEFMSSNQLTDFQLSTFSENLTSLGYGYGMGVRAEKNSSGSTDFGWGGAAGAYGGCDRKNDFTFSYMQQVLSMPNDTIRHAIPFYIREALGK